MNKSISRRHFLAGLTLGGATLLGPKKAGYGMTQTSPLSQDDLAKNYQHQDEYEDLIRQPALKLALTPHWFGDNTRFWYRNELGQGTAEFILVNAAHGTRGPAFDATKLAAALAKASGKPVQANRLPFSTIEFTPDGFAIRFPIGDAAWSVDLDTYTCTTIPKDTLTTKQDTPPADASAEDDSGGKPDGEVTSPDGAWTAFVKDSEVWIRAKDGTQTQISHNATPEQGYGELRWSPDSQTLIGFRIHNIPIKPVYMVESSPKDGGTRGVLHQHEYAQPGDPFSTYEMWLFHPTTKTATQAQVDVINYGDAPDLHWTKDNKVFTFERRDRGHQYFRVIAIDPQTGASHFVIDEQTKTFINTSNIYTYYTDKDEIIYASEQDGWRHLYLYDIGDAKLKNPITQGEWVMWVLDKVDETQRQVWLRGSGKNPGQDPYFIHYYRANFDGSGLTALTEGNGNHTVQYSPDQTYLIDTYSRVDSPPTHTLRRVADGTQVCELEKADISALTQSGWKMPEVFTAKGRDGKTDIWGVVFRPLHLDPHKHYPIIENIYAGPQDSFVRKTFAMRDAMQSLAELGFIVVQCDGMGTRNRSKAFHDVCWKNLADAGFPDRIAWMTALAEKYPYMDTNRVGIYGTSAGGQNSTGGVLFHPEFYKVAVSSCGCHDNRVDKQWWNEQWMGYPIGPWYAENSNVTHVGNLRGKLLLMVGELDTNVPPESTLRVADALINAGKDFDYLVLPGLDHTDGGTYGERRRRDYFVRHLLEVEPPDRNIPAPPVKPIVLTAHPASDEYLAQADGGEETKIVFHNLTKHTIQLFWLPGDGTHKAYDLVAAGAACDRHTYAGHTWLVTTEDGQGLAIFVAESRPGIANIHENQSRAVR